MPSFRNMLLFIAFPVVLWASIPTSGSLRLGRAIIYQETQTLCEQGYYHFQDKRVDFNPILKEKMVLNTQSYSLQEPFPFLESNYQTEVEIVEKDTFGLLLQYQNEGLHPVGLNMANPRNPGGGVQRGAASQEESLFRRSNYYQALCHRKKDLYPIEEASVIYTPFIQVFREQEFYDEEGNVECAFIEVPFVVDLIASAFYSMKKSPCQPVGYEEGTRNKIRNILRVAYLTGHDSLVLGAAGCGSFGNDPRLIARWFYEELNSPEFQGRFLKVGFGILYPEITYKNQETGKKQHLNLIEIFKNTFGKIL